MYNVLIMKYPLTLDLLLHLILLRLAHRRYLVLNGFDCLGR